MHFIFNQKKMHNFLLNYTDEKNVELIITPSSLNGFILIIVACVGGFLFLFLFLTIIYCASKKDKQNHKRKSYFSFTDFKSKKNSDIFFGAKNSYIKEKIEENQDEDQKSNGSENSDSNSEDNNSNNSDDKLFNIEEKKLDDATRVKVLSPGMLVAKRFFRNKLAIVFSGSDIDGVGNFLEDTKQNTEKIRVKILGSLNESMNGLNIAPKLNIALSTYYKETDLEEILNYLSQYLDSAKVSESDITCL